MTIRILALLTVMLLDSACGMSQTTKLALGDSTQNDILGKFRNTYYYMALESEFPEQQASEELLDLKDVILARVSKRFKKALDLEGTGKLRGGQVVNYAGKIDGKIRYHFTDFPFGHGVGSCELLPFHSVAVDKTQIPLGSVVHIDETLGMILPDGSKHDGNWRAEDIGGAIMKDRIDLFVGAGDQGQVLVKAGITHLKALTVRLISPPPQNSCVDKQLEGTQPRQP